MGEFGLDVHDAINIEAERDRLQKEIARIKDEIDKVWKKINSQDFCRALLRKWLRKTGHVMTNCSRGIISSSQTSSTCRCNSMSTLKHPKTLIDLGYAGENGLPMNSEPWFQRELELCREWGFRLIIVNERVRLEFDDDQLIPCWIQKETPAIAWDRLRVNGFLRVIPPIAKPSRMARARSPGRNPGLCRRADCGKRQKRATWFSPARTGIYFTLILRPEQPRKFWPLLTPCCFGCA